MGNEVDEEGHDMAKPGDKLKPNRIQFIPRLIGSAKLSKFMEHMHSKRKNAQAQGAEAVGHNAANAPAPGSTQAGQPIAKIKKYEGLKKSKKKPTQRGDSEPAAVAAAAGRKKYGKEAVPTRSCSW